MADETGKDKSVGVYVLGVDKAENNGPIYDALRSIGFAWCGQALSLNEGLRQLELIREQVHLIVVRAELARGGEEAALLEPVARWPLAVLVGAARAKHQAEKSGWPNVRAVISVPPYDFSALRDLYRELYRQVNPSSAAPVLTTVSAPQPAQAAPVPARPVSPDTRVTSQAAACTPAQRLAVSRLRIAFFGRRGGVGTSTAALHAAQLLANTGLKVVLFDAGQRGDLHLMLGEQPAAQPLHKAGLTLYLTAPNEELADGYEAVVIDAGRQHGTFNAQWIEVQRPFDEPALRRLVGLPLVDQSDSPQPTRRLGFPRLFSIEVTE